MGRKILVICSILVLVSNIVGFTSVSCNVTTDGTQKMLLCDQGDIIGNLQLKL